eukprot:26834-Eustigmatos_ZCMA.PRE.1
MLDLLAAVVGRRKGRVGGQKTPTCRRHNDVHRRPARRTHSAGLESTCVAGRRVICLCCWTEKPVFGRKAFISRTMSHQ